MNPTEEAIKGLMDEWKSQRFIFQLPDTYAMRMAFAAGARYALITVAENVADGDEDATFSLNDAITVFATSTINTDEAA